MKCRKCGAENAANINFCTSCGAPLKRRRSTSSKSSNKKKSQSWLLFVAGIVAGSCITATIILMLPQTPVSSTISTEKQQRTYEGKKSPERESVQSAKTKTWNVSLNKAYIADRIDQRNNKFMVVEPGDNKLFVVAEFMFENRTKKAASLKSVNTIFSVTDGNGYSSEENPILRRNLANPLRDAVLQPGARIRGEVFLPVKDSATDIVINARIENKELQWQLFENTGTAISAGEIYNVSNKETSK